MFEQVPPATLQRAIHPPVRYGRRILAETLREMQQSYHAESYIILTQPEAWEVAREQFSDADSNRVIYLRSVDAAVTNTIAGREGQRVRYTGFSVADAIPVDFAVISQAPAALNRAGISDLLSIHTALWDWQHASQNFDVPVAVQVAAILEELDARFQYRSL